MSKTIKRISIEGFKSFFSLQNLELKNLNILIGPNGAGKTNLVDFFRLLAAVLADDVPHFVASMGGFDNLLHRGPNPCESMIGMVDFGEQVINFRLCSDHRGGFFVERADSGPLMSPTPDSILRVIPSLEAPTDSRLTIQILLSLRDSSPLHYNRIVETIRLVLPDFEGFAAPEADEPTKLLWKKKGTADIFPESALSHGSRRFICLAAELIRPDSDLPGTLIFDEPETALGPDTLGVLAGLLHEASTKSTVIVATQSPVLLNHFEVEETILLSTQDGSSVLKRLDARDFQGFLEDYSLADLWLKNIF